MQNGFNIRRNLAYELFLHAIKVHNQNIEKHKNDKKKLAKENSKKEVGRQQT